jgi:hypothetical protein
MTQVIFLDLFLQFIFFQLYPSTLSLLKIKFSNLSWVAFYDVIMTWYVEGWPESIQYNIFLILLKIIIVNTYFKSNYNFINYINYF